MQNLYVGCDVSKRDMDVAVALADQTIALGKMDNNATGYHQLAAALTEYVADGAKIHLVLEPTGTYHLGLVAYAHQEGWLVSLPNPTVVREWSRGQGQRTKTDAVDAQMLARYGHKEAPSPESELPEHVLELDLMLRRLEDLKQDLRRERNRLEALDHRPGRHKAVRQDLLKSIRQRQAALDAMLRRIKQHLDSYPQLKQLRSRLLKIPGIGEKSVLKILVFLFRWDAHTAADGDAKGLTAYAGLDPRTHTSGSSIARRAHISKMGDGHIRATLYLCALGGSHAHSSPLVSFYKNLLLRGKPKKLALVAGARKILTWAFAVFRSGLHFDAHKAMPRHL